MPSFCDQTSALEPFKAKDNGCKSNNVSPGLRTCSHTSDEESDQEEAFSQFATFDNEDSGTRGTKSKAQGQGPTEG